MDSKLSIRDKVVDIIYLVFLILSLTKSSVIWSSKLGYYIQITIRISICIVLAIIVILDLVDLNQKLKNRKLPYSKKQIIEMLSKISIRFIILICFILIAYAYIYR